MGKSSAHNGGGGSALDAAAWSVLRDTALGALEAAVPLLRPLLPPLGRRGSAQAGVGAGTESWSTLGLADALSLGLLVVSALEHNHPAAAGAAALSLAPLADTLCARLGGASGPEFSSSPAPLPRQLLYRLTAPERAALGPAAETLALLAAATARLVSRVPVGAEGEAALLLLPPPPSAACAAAADAMLRASSALLAALRRPLTHAEQQQQQQPGGVAAAPPMPPLRARVPATAFLSEPVALSPAALTGVIAAAVGLVRWHAAAAAAGLRAQAHGGGTSDAAARAPSPAPPTSLTLTARAWAADTCASAVSLRLQAPPAAAAAAAGDVDSPADDAASLAAALALLTEHAERAFASSPASITEAMRLVQKGAGAAGRLGVLADARGSGAEAGAALHAALCSLAEARIASLLPRYAQSRTPPPSPLPWPRSDNGGEGGSAAGDSSAWAEECDAAAAAFGEVSRLANPSGLAAAHRATILAPLCPVVAPGSSRAARQDSVPQPQQQAPLPLLSPLQLVAAGVPAAAAPAAAPANRRTSSSPASAGGLPPPLAATFVLPSSNARRRGGGGSAFDRLAAALPRVSLAQVLPPLLHPGPAGTAAATAAATLFAAPPAEPAWSLTAVEFSVAQALAMLEAATPWMSTPLVIGGGGSRGGAEVDGACATQLVRRRAAVASANLVSSLGELVTAAAVAQQTTLTEELALLVAFGAAGLPTQRGVFAALAARVASKGSVGMLDEAPPVLQGTSGKAEEGRGGGTGHPLSSPGSVAAAAAAAPDAQWLRLQQRLQLQAVTTPPPSLPSSSSLVRALHGLVLGFSLDEQDAWAVLLRALRRREAARYGTRSDAQAHAAALAARRGEGSIWARIRETLSAESLTLAVPPDPARAYEPPPPGLAPAAAAALWARRYSFDAGTWQPASDAALGAVASISHFDAARLRVCAAVLRRWAAFARFADELPEQRTRFDDARPDPLADPLTITPAELGPAGDGLLTPAGFDPVQWAAAAQGLVDLRGAVDGLAAVLARAAAAAQARCGGGVAAAAAEAPPPSPAGAAPAWIAFEGDDSGRAREQPEQGGRPPPSLFKDGRFVRGGGRSDYTYFLDVVTRIVSAAGGGGRRAAAAAGGGALRGRPGDSEALPLPPSSRPLPEDRIRLEGAPDAEQPDASAEASPLAASLTRPPGPPAAATASSSARAAEVRDRLARGALTGADLVATWVRSASGIVIPLALPHHGVAIDIRGPAHTRPLPAAARAEIEAALLRPPPPLGAAAAAAAAAAANASAAWALPSTAALLRSALLAADGWTVVTLHYSELPWAVVEEEKRLERGAGGAGSGSSATSWRGPVLRLDTSALGHAAAVDLLCRHLPAGLSVEAASQAPHWQAPAAAAASSSDL